MLKIKEYFIPDSDNHFIEYFKQFNHYQEAQRNRAMAHVENWRFAIDIGANIGLWSKELSNFFEKLVCFEPNPNCKDYLKKNINLKNSKIHFCALGSNDETRNLFIHPSNSDASSFVNRIKLGYQGNSEVVYGEFSKDTKEINVKIKKLDSFNFLNIDFIKIDVQGFELEVLKGAVETLDLNNPIICIEEDDPNKSNTIPFLRSLNYDIIDIINKEHIFKKTK